MDGNLCICFYSCIDRSIGFVHYRIRERERGIEKDWKNRIRFSSCLLAFVSSWAMVADDDDDYDYDDDKLRDMRTLASCNNSHLKNNNKHITSFRFRELINNIIITLDDRRVYLSSFISSCFLCLTNSPNSDKSRESNLNILILIY